MALNMYHNVINIILSSIVFVILCATPVSLTQNVFFANSQMYVDVLLSVCVLSCFSHVLLFVTLWTVAARLPCPWDSPGKNSGVGCHALLQGIFPTQGSKPGLPHCRWILYHLNLSPKFSKELQRRSWVRTQRLVVLNVGGSLRLAEGRRRKGVCQSARVEACLLINWFLHCSSVWRSKMW